jgi:hypothetical protein
MIENHSNVIIGFGEWRQRRNERRHDPLANHALDKCEEAFKKREWRNFGYWHAIYMRERQKRPKRGREGYRP